MGDFMIEPLLKYFPGILPGDTTRGYFPEILGGTLRMAGDLSNAVLVDAIFADAVLANATFCRSAACLPAACPLGRTVLTLHLMHHNNAKVVTTMNTQRDQSWPVPDGVFGETVTEVEHYTDRLFRFRLTRPASFRFRSGEFVMIGLPGEKPVWRAYSIASPSWDETIEFYSIKVAGGPLTEHLQKIGVGDQVWFRKKPTGTLVLDALLPGKRLWMISTGTGFAPFASLIRDITGKPFTSD
jgi:hypothetical protein